MKKKNKKQKIKQKQINIGTKLQKVQLIRPTLPEISAIYSGKLR